MRLLVVCLFSLSICCQQAKAETTVPGSNCHSITPAQAGLMEWREQGLKNSASTDYWINCPFERAAGKAELELTVRAVNETDYDISISCYFREFFNGERKQAKSSTSEISGGGSDDVSVLITPKERDSVLNATCKLTKGITIEATSIGFSDTCSYANFAGGWGYTMAYGYDGVEVGIGFLSEDGSITGQTDDGQSTRDVTGFYDVSANECTVQGEVAFSDGVVVRIAGFLSEDQGSITFAAVNNYGYFTNGTMVRLAGIGARGKGSVGRIAKPRLGLGPQAD